MSYVLISRYKYDKGGWQGKVVLVSYAQAPLWKSFESLFRQNNRPSTMDLVESKRALKKYANPENFEVITQEQFQLEYDEFVNSKTINNA